MGYHTPKQNPAKRLGSRRGLVGKPKAISRSGSGQESMMRAVIVEIQCATLMETQQSPGAAVSGSWEQTRVL